MATRSVILPDRRYQLDAVDVNGSPDRFSYRERFKSQSAAEDRAADFLPAGQEGTAFAVTIKDRWSGDAVVYSA